MTAPPMVVEEGDLLEERILIVDDQPANVELLESLLHKEGFGQVLGICEPDQALDLAAAFEPDLILLDLHMPGVDGYSLLEALSRRRAPDDYLPILVITADATRNAKHRALALGAKDFLTKPIDSVEAMLRVWNLLETRELCRRLRHQGPTIPSVRTP